MVWGIQQICYYQFASKSSISMNPCLCFRLLILQVALVDLSPNRLGDGLQA